MNTNKGLWGKEKWVTNIEKHCAEILYLEK